MLPVMHAFLVGNGEYDDPAEFPRLDYAPADAVRLYELVTNSPSALFQRASSWCLKNVTRDELEKALETSFELVAANDLVLFYFAGHARVMPSGRRHVLIMRNSKTKSLAGSTFTVDRLIPYLDEKKVSRYVVVLDCCHAEEALDSSSVRARGTAPQHPIPDWSGHGKMLVAAAGKYQRAHEIETLKHGVFSHYFAIGIERGEAAERTKPFVSAQDLCAYVQYQIATHHPELNQEPVVSGEDVTGILLLARNVRYEVQKVQHAEILEYMKKSLDVSDLSDSEKLHAARVKKLRTFLDGLRKKSAQTFPNLWPEVLAYSEALLLDESYARKEFEASKAISLFESPKQVVPSPAPLNGRGQAALFSAAYGSMAAENDLLESGVFSYHFRQALFGAASNAEGMVTLATCFAYVRSRLQEEDGPHRQSPVLVSNLTSEPVLTGKAVNWKSALGRRMALCVGIDHYSANQLPDLRFAERDASRTAEVLANLGGFECRVLSGEAATVSAVVDAVGEVLTTLTEMDLFLFFFSGHGLSFRDDGAMLLYDVILREPEPFNTGALNLKALFELVKWSRVGTTLIIADTCMAPAIPVLLR
jgi:uncharacterized caspase-like protein